MIPSRLDYGDGKPTRVTVTNQRHMEHGKTLGAFDAETRAIRIAAFQTPHDERDTLTHEILHDVFERAGLTKLGITRAVEERIIARISPWLFEALSRSEGLLEYLREES